MEKNRNLPLVILDKDYHWQDNNAVVVHWSTFSSKENEYSIPQLVDQNGEELRDEYLSLIYKLGKEKIKGASLCERMLIRENLSFWWLTLITEKCSVKSKGVYEIFKLRTLENLYYNLNCSGIVLCSSNRRLHKTLWQWCKAKEYSYKKIAKRKWRLPTLRALYNILPHPVRAMLFLCRYLIVFNAFFNSKREKISPSIEGDDNLCIFTYFGNFDMDLAFKGVFRSYYWNNLHDVIQRSGKNTVWIHQFVQSASCPTPTEALLLRDQFNENNTTSRHFFLREWFSWCVLFRVIHLYFRLLFLSLIAPSFRSSCHFKDSSLPLWEFMAYDWSCSIRGSVAMSECIRLVLFEEVFSRLSHQKTGLFLLEGQVWERSLIHAWKANNHGKIIGCQHSKLPFFDLRLIHDRRIYAEKPSREQLPLADIVAINGHQAMEMLENSGYPMKYVFLTEALRFLYLNRLQNLNEQTIRLNSKRLFLVILDGVEQVDRWQLSIVTQLVNSPSFSQNVNILIKPHPNPQVPSEILLDQRALKFPVEISTENLSNLWGKADFVFVSGNSSASVEAAIIGLPMILLWDPSGFNRSPLREIPNIVFVTSYKDFITAYDNILEPPRISHLFFCLDESMIRWKKLLHI